MTGATTQSDSKRDAAPPTDSRLRRLRTCVTHTLKLALHRSERAHRVHDAHGDTKRTPDRRTPRKMTKMTNQGPVVRRPRTAPADAVPVARSSVARELRAATEELSEVFRRAEIAMRRFGVEGSVVIGSDDDGPLTLAFEKRGREWQLLFVFVQPVGDEVGSAPIASAPRAIRVAAASKLGELVEVLNNAARLELDGVQRALAHASAVVVALETDAPPSDPTADEIPF